MDSNERSIFTQKHIEIIMQVQVRLNERETEMYAVREGQTAEEIAEKVAQKHDLSEDIKITIRKGIQMQLDKL